MTNEKMLKRLMEMRDMLDEENRSAYDMAMKHKNEIQGFAKYTLGGNLAELAYTIEREIMENEDKKSGKGAALQAAKRVLKRGEKKHIMKRCNMLQ